MSSLRRSRIGFMTQLASRPLAQNRCGAYCMTCRRPSDEEILVEEHRGDKRNEAKVLVRCHGAEELGTFEFDSEQWTLEDDLKRGMQRVMWFNPMSHEQVGSISNNGKIED